MNRPTSDPNDSHVGFDQPGSVPPDRSQLAVGSPVSISQYIGNAGDNVSWLERLTGSAKNIQGAHPQTLVSNHFELRLCYGSCTSAPAGIIAIPLESSKVTVSTTAVTAKSDIHVDENTTYRPLLGLTCDASFRRHYQIIQQVGGTGFTTTTDMRPNLNPACWSFTITN
jgi:hypothetical protein